MFVNSPFLLGWTETFHLARVFLVSLFHDASQRANELLAKNAEALAAALTHEQLARAVRRRPGHERPNSPLPRPECACMSERDLLAFAPLPAVRHADAACCALLTLS